ncbi:MAG: DUF3575 domain-containing protein [Bacteroidota bacterium]
MIWRIFIAITIATAFSLALKAQLRDSSQNGIGIALITNAGEVTVPIISYERLLKPRLSAVASIGAAPPKKGINGISFLHYHLSLEARYYFALRRDSPMSGFFVGPYASFTESYSWYRDVNRKAIRRYLSSIGIGAGYQQLIRERIRISGEIILAYPGKIISERWDRQGFRRARFEWEAWRTWYASISVGYSF